MTGEWESQCDERNSPKMKFPLKLLDDSMKELDLGFSDPVVKEPETPKKKNHQEIKVVELKTKKKKDKKKNLF
jgi:hypothetical protein